MLVAMTVTMMLLKPQIKSILITVPNLYPLQSLATSPVLKK